VVEGERETPLREADVAADPLEQFRFWFAEAATAVETAEAVALATATSDGAPSARMVLLKRADEDGFAFFSGYESRKGNELAANPRAALLFYWHALGRQVRVEGLVERLSERESDAYFDSRPAASRLSAAASPQSEVVPSREALEARVRELEGVDVRRPESWGGFVLVPHTYEFWQHRDNRLHDRLRYRRAEDTWVLERLAP
jgi:pyridoxamine 5'-phosphate oxidase